MKRWILIGFMVVLLIIPISMVWAKEDNGKIGTLEQAVQAAQALYLQSIPPETHETSPAKGTSDSAEGVPADKSTGEEQEDTLTQESATEEVTPPVKPEEKYRKELNQVSLEVAHVVIDLDYAQKKVGYLIQREAELKEKITQTEKDFKMGKVKVEVLEELKKEQSQIGFDLNLAKLQIENGKKTFMKLTGKGISEDFKYDAAYLIIDGGKLSLPSSVDQLAQGKEIRSTYSEVLAAFGELGDGVSDYIEACEQVTQLEKDFKMGKADQQVLTAALEKRDKSKVLAYEKKASYSKALYTLDCGLDGYISRDVKKVAHPIFRKGD